MAASMASRAMTVASTLPVWPTMSPPAKLARIEAVAALGHGAVDGVGRLGRTHPWPLLERHLVRGNLDVLLQGVVELAGAVAVPEVGDVAELLGFRAGELGHAGRRQVFAQGAADLGRRHQVVLGYAQVAVVEHHAGERHVRHPVPVEAVEPGAGGEGPGHLHGAVAAEVEEDHPVAVFDGGHRAAVRIPHGERRQHLVADAGLPARGSAPPPPRRWGTPRPRRGRERSSPARRCSSRPRTGPMVTTIRPPPEAIR